MAATAAQAAPLLAGLAPAGAGNLRSLHPADRVELWLDEAALVPLALRVIAAPTGERRASAASHGYRDRPGQVVLELALLRVSLNRPLEADAFPPPPAGAEAEDAGFRDRDPGGAGPGSPADREMAATAPAWLPAGFRPYRAGMAGGRLGQRWPSAPGPTGGRGFKVPATRNWPGGRLFGDLGELVHQPASAPVWPTGARTGPRVAVHGRGLDLLVTGSMGEADLARVAASLPVAGRPVPAGWAEAATSTLPEAVAADPALRRPRDLRGFAPPAVRVDGGTVTLAYAGPGSRGFLLVQAPGDRLTPPLAEATPAGVRVRGTDGRWSPGRGELEWVKRRRRR